MTLTQKNFRQKFFLLSLLVRRNIKNQYYRSVIGIIWTVLNPLLNMLVMAFVFSAIFGTTTDGLDYPIYILSGNILFNIVRSSTTSALPCLVQQREMLLKTRVPMKLFPAANVFSSVITFMFSMVALLIVMATRAIGGFYVFHWQIVLVLALLPALTIFSLGISFFLSAIYVFFRDIKHIYSVFLTLWTYLTPLFYSLTSIRNATAAKIVRLNPMYHLITLFRSMLTGSAQSPASYLISYLYAAAAFIGGIFFFRAIQDHIAAKL